MDARESTPSRDSRRNNASRRTIVNPYAKSSSTLNLIRRNLLSNRQVTTNTNNSRASQNQTQNQNRTQPSNFANISIERPNAILEYNYVEGAPPEEMDNRILFPDTIAVPGTPHISVNLNISQDPMSEIPNGHAPGYKQSDAQREATVLDNTVQNESSTNTRPENSDGNDDASRAQPSATSTSVTPSTPSQAQVNLPTTPRQSNTSRSQTSNTLPSMSQVATPVPRTSTPSGRPDELTVNNDKNGEEIDLEGLQDGETLEIETPATPVRPTTEYRSKYRSSVMAFINQEEARVSSGFEQQVNHMSQKERMITYIDSLIATLPNFLQELYRVQALELQSQSFFIKERENGLSKFNNSDTPYVPISLRINFELRTSKEHKGTKEYKALQREYKEIQDEFIEKTSKLCEECAKSNINFLKEKRLTTLVELIDLAARVYSNARNLPGAGKEIQHFVTKKIVHVYFENETEDIFTYLGMERERVMKLVKYIVTLKEPKIWSQQIIEMITNDIKNAVSHLLSDIPKLTIYVQQILEIEKEKIRLKREAEAIIARQRISKATEATSAVLNNISLAQHQKN